MQLLSNLLWAAVRSQSLQDGRRRRNRGCVGERSQDRSVRCPGRWRLSLRRAPPPVAPCRRGRSAGHGDRSWPEERRGSLRCSSSTSTFTDSRTLGAFRSPGLKTPKSKSTTSSAGLIAGNVYLFAASRGLAWFSNCDRNRPYRASSNCAPRSASSSARRLVYPERG